MDEINDDVAGTEVVLVSGAGDPGAPATAGHPRSPLAGTPSPRPREQPMP
ncbi:hypothetical protein ACFS2C_02965 [Prauserella oleivorans]|uniref:Uncharacterized protein n=1 Tax=Prauserella oleivorans TaxID=1478153 RepID=A0ABW5W5E3_9PSEU